MEKVSLQMFTMREHTKTPEALRKTLEKLKDIGFNTVQYSVPGNFDYKEVRKIFDEVGMTNDSILCPPELVKDNTELLRRCEIFSTDYIRTIGIPRENTTSGEGYKEFAHYLNENSKELKAHNKKILYHFHAFEFAKFGDKTGMDIFLEETDPEVIQIIPDTHWIQSGGKDPASFLKKYSGRYDYVHVKDFRIGVMGATWEARPIMFAPVGDGNLDWKGIIDVCKQNNVKSYAIEQDDCYGENAFDCVERSINYLIKAGISNK